MPKKLKKLPTDLIRRGVSARKSKYEYLLDGGIWELTPSEVPAGIRQVLCVLARRRGLKASVRTRANGNLIVQTRRADR